MRSPSYSHPGSAVRRSPMSCAVRASMGPIQADRRGQRVASSGGLEASVRLPMFPLGTVLFPHMVLPLHVFEPRYRVLTRRCLDGEPMFGVVLIVRGSEVGGDDE